MKSKTTVLTLTVAMVIAGVIGSMAAIPLQQASARINPDKDGTGYSGGTSYQSEGIYDNIIGGRGGHYDYDGDSASISGGAGVNFDSSSGTIVGGVGEHNTCDSSGCNQEGGDGRHAK